MTAVVCSRGDLRLEEPCSVSPVSKPRGLAKIPLKRWQRGKDPPGEVRAKRKVLSLLPLVPILLSGLWPW